MTEFAKDAPPEMIQKLLETCKWQADNDGKCKANCSSCPGAAAYNDGSTCGKNGWTDGTFSISDKSPTTKSNAESFIEHHTKAKPAPKTRKNPQPVVMPDHLQILIDDAESRTKVAVHGVEDLNRRLKAARQILRATKAAHRATVAQVKKEAKK